MATVNILPKIEIDDEGSMCGICLSDLKSPSTLPCLHAFCCNCLQDWARHVSGRVTCPKCRGEAGLHVRRQAMNPHTPPCTPSSSRRTTRHRSRFKTRGQETVVCASCKIAGKQILARCLKCNDLCKECVIKHQRLYRGLNDHHVTYKNDIDKGWDIDSDSKSGNSLVLENTFGDDTDENCLIDARNVVHTQSGYFAVTDCNNKSRVKVFNRYGKFKFSFDTKNGQDPISVPYGIVENSSGELFVTDESPHVKVYDSDGVPLRQFTTISPGGRESNEEPTWILGLAIDTSGHILVGETRQMYISIHQQDGSHMSSLKVSMKPHYIATSPNKEIIISSGVDSFIHVIDYNGVLLRTIKSYSMKCLQTWNPKGVCCNQHGDIFVADATVGSEGIYRYSVTGKYLGCVVRNVSSPHGIVLTKDFKRLIVVEDHCVKVFKWIST